MKSGTTLDHETKSSYAVTVTASDAYGGSGELAVTVNVTDVNEPPAAPTGLSVSAQGTTTLRASWTAPGNAGKPDISGYDVQYRQGTSGVWSNGPQNVSATTADIASLTASTAYQVQVRAKNDEGDGPWTAAVSGTTSALTAPVAPTGLTATKDDRFAIDLSWTAPAADAARAAVTGYKIEWSANGTDGWTALATITDVATVTHKDSGLGAGTTRHYRVKATSSAGAGAWSASASATTDANAAPAFDPATASREVDENAAAETDVGAAIPEATDDDGDTLTYALGGVDAGSFDFDADTRQITVKSGTSLDYEAKTSYAVTVTASDSYNGSGSVAVTINVTDVNEPPAAPTGLSVSPQGTTVLRATWVAPGNAGKPDISGYDVQYRQGTSGTWGDHTHSSTAVTADIGSLTANTAYQVRVRAKNAEGDGAWTAAVSGTTSALTAPVAPTGLTATKDDRFAIDLSWTAPAADATRAPVTGYKIEWSANGTDGWTALATITGASTVTHEDSGLSAGTTRYYRVLATSAAGDSAWSSSASATTDANAAPAFDPNTATRSVAENAAAETDVGAVIPAATDADGDTLTYAMSGTDAGSFEFNAGTRQITVKSGTTLDHETKSSYAVTVTATDGHGGSGELAVTVSVNNLDEAGSVTFGSPAPAVGTALTASLMDPDGNVSSVTWQWAKADAQDGTYADITSATSASYTPAADDAGAWLRATASYTDGHGSGKSAEAVAAAAVADTTGPSVTGALAITSESGVSKANDTIEVTVTFDEAIVVTGTPELRIRVGSGSGSEKTATCARKGSTGDDAKKLVCSYTVASGDEDTDGVSVEANKLSLPSSATIKDSSNNDAALTHAALPAQSGHKVDAVAPAVTAGSTGYFSDAAAATALTGPQKAAANIYTKVTFSEDMKHTKGDGAAARPELFHRIGTTDAQYDIVDNGDTLASGDCKPEDSTGTDVYVCLYTVGSSDNGAFTVKAGTNSQDKADNALAAVYTHTATLTLDTTDPGISFPAGAPTTGAAATITLTDAGAKIKKYGAIVVDGSATTAAGCDTAPEVGAGNLETLDTAATPVDYSYTPPADSAGKKICVYAEDAAGNSHAELWTTAIAAAAPTPAKPTGFTQTAGAGQVTLSWADPEDSTITKYQYQQKAGDGAWGAWTDIPSSAPGGANATSYTVTDLMDGTAYRFRIRAVNAGGSGPNLASAGPATPQATVAPPSDPSKLVGNVTRPVASGHEITFRRDMSQRFTTGRHPGGYTLTHLDLAIENRGANEPSYSVKIHKPQSSDRGRVKSTLPGAVLGTLTNPGSLPGRGGGFARFTASGGGIDLDPGSTYLVVIDVGEGATRRVKVSTASGLDRDGVAHWRMLSISRYRKAGSTGRWLNNPSVPLRMAVYGTAKAAPPPDPALVPAGALWSASLTVQGYRNLLGGALGCGLSTGARCSVGLSNNEFTYNGVRYRFDAIQRDSNRDTLQLSILNPAADPEEVLEAGAALAASGSLTLHVDGRAFAFADARLQYERLHWDDARLGWRTWQRVSLALTDAGAPSGAPAPGGAGAGVGAGERGGAGASLRRGPRRELPFPRASAFAVSVAGASRSGCRRWR